MEYLEILPPCLLFTSRQNIKMNQNTKYSAMWTSFQYLNYQRSLPPVWYNAASPEQICWTCCCRTHQTICQNILLVAAWTSLQVKLIPLICVSCEQQTTKKSDSAKSGQSQGVVKFQFRCMLLLLKWVIQLCSWISSSNFCLLKLWVAVTGLQDCCRSFRSKFLALSLDFFTWLHTVLMSTVSSPLSSDGSFIIVPQKLGNFWLSDEDMVENELSILNQIQQKPLSFTSCTLWQTAAQGTGNKLGQVLLPLHQIPCKGITFQQALYQTNGITFHKFHNCKSHNLCNVCVIWDFNNLRSVCGI